MKATSQYREKWVLSVATPAMALGLVSAMAARGSSPTATTAFIADAGQILAGCSFAICMVAIMLINGGTGGMTFEERAPSYAVRAVGFLGVATGLMLAVQAATSMIAG
jgi:hypothetical protein